MYFLQFLLILNKVLDSYWFQLLLSQLRETLLLRKFIADSTQLKHLLVYILVSKSEAKLDNSVILRPSIVKREQSKKLIGRQSFSFSLSAVIFIHRRLKSGTLLSQRQNEKHPDVVSLNLYFCTQHRNQRNLALLCSKIEGKNHFAPVRMPST